MCVTNGYLTRSELVLLFALVFSIIIEDHVIGNILGVIHTDVVGYTQIYASPDDHMTTEICASPDNHMITKIRASPDDRMTTEIRASSDERVTTNC